MAEQPLAQGYIRKGQSRNPFWWVALAAILLLPHTVQAQDEHHAGLVVMYGDGRIEQQCVAFGEESISGYELLQRAGLTLNVEAGAIGAAVCAINGEGCSYPAESCFCRCQSSPCVYWSYWRRQPNGDWRYQVLGAANSQVRDGAVEGWRWAAGPVDAIQPPPQVQFDQLCNDQSPADVGPVDAGQPISVSAAATTLPAQANAQTRRAITNATTAAGSSAESNSSQENGQSATAMPAGAEAVTEEEDTTVASTQGLWLLMAAVVVTPAALLLLWALLRKGH